MKLKKALINVLSAICVVLFIVITIIGTYQVFSRYALNRPSAWSEELLTYGFAWMTFIAIALVFGKRDHMKLSFVIEKFSGQKRKNIEIINEIIVLIFSTLVFIYGGLTICKLTILQITPALQLKMGLIYSIIPITGILIDIFSILNIQEIKNTDYEKLSEEA